MKVIGISPRAKETNVNIDTKLEIDTQEIYSCKAESNRNANTNIIQHLMRYDNEGDKKFNYVKQEDTYNTKKNLLNFINKNNPGNVNVINNNIDQIHDTRDQSSNLNIDKINKDNDCVSTDHTE